MAVVRYAFLLRRYFATDITWCDGKNLLFMWVILSLLLVLTVTVHRVLEVNTGLICSCTLAFKPFLRHLASKSRSQGFTSYRKSSGALGERKDSKGGKGFLALEDDGIEMRGPGVLQVEHRVWRVKEGANRVPISSGNTRDGWTYWVLGWLAWLFHHDVRAHITRPSFGAFLYV